MVPPAGWLCVGLLILAVILTLFQSRAAGRHDQLSRRVLDPIVQQPARAMLFRQSIADGHLFDLGAVDGLGRFVQLRSGRLPKTCTPERCEVLQLGGAGPIPASKSATECAC